MEEHSNNTKLSDIYSNNPDLDTTFSSNNITLALKRFSKVMNQIIASYKPIREAINSFVTKFIEITKPLRAVALLADNQYVIWEPLSDDFIDDITECKSISKFLRISNEKDRYKSTKAIANKCAESHLLNSNKRVFDQSIKAFSRGDYDLAVVGLTSVIDGVVTILSGSNITSIYKRTKPLIDKMENADSFVEFSKSEMSLMLFVYTFDKTLQSFTANSDFTKSEPKLLNRHWIMHGRSKKRKTKLDCVKLIRIIYGFTILEDYTVNVNHFSELT